MPLSVTINKRTKHLVVTYDTKSGEVRLSFPMLRCRICTKCGDAVSVWAIGSTKDLPDLHAHRGGWRVHPVKGGFVMAAPDGHRFDDGDEDPRCRCDTAREILGHPSGEGPLVNLAVLAAMDALP